MYCRNFHWLIVVLRSKTVKAGTEHFGHRVERSNFEWCRSKAEGSGHKTSVKGIGLFIICKGGMSCTHRVFVSHTYIKDRVDYGIMLFVQLHLFGLQERPWPPSCLLTFVMHM